MPLKDGCDVIVGHLKNVNNNFINEKKFSNNLKSAYVHILDCSKKMILINLSDIFSI